MLKVRRDEPSNTPDVYFSAAYGRLDARVQKGEWITVSDESGEWQLPLVLIPTGNDRYEALSPYGYSGLSVRPALASDAVREYWSQSRAILAGMGVISLFLRFSPLDDYSKSLSSGLPSLAVRRSGTTYLNRIGDTEVMWQAMEGRARTAVRKARHNGLTSEARVASSADLIDRGEFRRLYENTMDRVHASTHYYFADDYYRGIQQGLGDALIVVYVRNREFEVVASALLMVSPRAVHYHLSGSDPFAARFGANALLIWSIMEWCADNGHAWLHLGGGVTEGDGLAKFKRSFGGEHREFCTGRCILDEPYYLELTRARARELGVTVSELTDSSYFPAFRAGGEL